MKSIPLFTAAFLCLVLAGCGSSYSIGTVNGKMSCNFSNQKVSKVCEVFTKSFGPLKGYSADIPGDLKDTQVTFGMSDVTTAEEVRKKLEEVTEYKVELDDAKKVIRFTKK